MWKRVLLFGAIAAIVVAAVISSLLVLDVVTAPELRDTLGKTLLVIGILTSAILLSIGAVRVGMGPRNFIRRFKAATGQLPGAYIQMLRVSAAKDMLEQGAASIQVVCRKIGYEDIAFFRSIFKRHAGMTPAEYRARFARLHVARGELAHGRTAA